MSDEIDVNGYCHCGNITINATIKKSEVRACHCTDCQKFSCAPFRAVAMTSAEQVAICGSVKE